MASVLVVDDESSVREMLGILLEKEGHLVSSASGVREATALLKHDPFDAVLSDIRMPDGSGIDVLRAARETDPDTIVILLTAFATTDTAVEAMKLGAYDYITKPFNVDDLKAKVRKGLETKQLRAENRGLRQAIEGRYGFRGIVGSSPRLQQVYEVIERVKDTRANVLITGESGTGKEVVARAIHFASKRAVRPFVAVNCGAIPKDLIESELFGHTKGAFTGAVAEKAGLFEQAEGGTLFLDEIGELPLDLQVKLLRVIQDRTFRRVGGQNDIQVDVRIIAATNRDLARQVADKTFREDLFYRLNVVGVELPPLRDRREDIPLLALHFLHKFTQETGRRITTISREAMSVLETMPYPGNVRELENIIERAVALESTDVITPASLPARSGDKTEGAVHHPAGIVGDGRPAIGIFPIRGVPLPVADFDIPAEGLSLEDYIGEIERRAIMKALDRTGGAKKEAADLLGLTFRAFRYRCEKYRID